MAGASIKSKGIEFRLPGNAFVPIDDWKQMFQMGWDGDISRRARPLALLPTPVR